MATQTDAEIMLDYVIGWPIAGEQFDRWNEYLSGFITLDEFTAELTREETISLVAWSEWFHRRLVEVIAQTARSSASAEADQSSITIASS